MGVRSTVILRVGRYYHFNCIKVKKGEITYQKWRYIMTYGSNEKGEATIELTAEEHEKFKTGEPVSKVTGCASGIYRITLKMEKISNGVNSMPEYVWLDNAYWKLTERPLFGYGYYKLTSDLRMHPRGSFVVKQQMYGYLISWKAKVVRGEPVKNVQIVDAVDFV
jgi:hypothetical protein